MARSTRSGTRTDLDDGALVRGAQPLRQRLLNDLRLSRHRVGLNARLCNGAGELATGETQEFLEVGAAIVRLGRLVELAENEVHVVDGRLPQALLQPGDGDAKRGHRVADVVSTPLAICAAPASNE